MSTHEAVIKNETLPANTTVRSEEGARYYQEDRYVVEELCVDDRHLPILAVMDGHGGEKVSELAKTTLVELLRRGIENAGGNITAGLSSAVEALNDNTRSMRAGSTLSLVVVDRENMRAHVAILGDSPVIIQSDKPDLNISPDHNAISNPVERNAAIARGAEFDGMYLIDPSSGSGLQMARALGDCSLDSFLSREPEVYEVGLNYESFIVVASDGVIDPAHETTEEEIERLVKMVAEGASASDLVEDAIKRQTGDNVTAIVWRA